MAKALDADYADGGTVTVISGIAGVGKSSVANQWLRQHAWPDGELYADLNSSPGPPGAETVLRQWLRALGLEPLPADQVELEGLWRSVTCDRRLAVLLDNATTAEQVQLLLPAGPGCVTLVTSRTALWTLAAAGARHYSLGPLSTAAALELLGRFVGAERIAAEPQAAAQLVDACAHLPLPLVLAGARLKARPSRSLAAAADALAHPHHKEAALMAITSGLTQSYAGLEATAQGVYRSMGLLPVNCVDAHMLSAVCRLRRGEADRVLEDLADEQLLEPRDPTHQQVARYHMGAVVREHAHTLATQHDGPTEQEGTVRRLCSWMLAVATQAQRRLTPAQGALRHALPLPTHAPAVFDDDPGAMAWLEAHEHDLLGVLRAAVAIGSDEVAWQLVDAFWPLFLRRHPYTLWAQAHEIGVAAARRVGNAAAVRQMLLSGAIGLSSAGHLTDAIDWYTQALNDAQAEGDARDEGQALLGLGTVHHDAGQPGPAEQHLTRAVTLWTGCGYRRGVALATILLGELSLVAGQLRRARTQFAEAHTTLMDVDDAYDAARALALHGHAWVQLGRADVGVVELEKALEVFVAASSTRWRARALEMLGAAHRDRGSREAAHACYREAADLYAVIRPDDAERLRQLEHALQPPQGLPPPRPVVHSYTRTSSCTERSHEVTPSASPEQADSLDGPVV
ncbi:hypothetical protein [Streptomyces sp. NPDC015125]|uniref:hypothetical protein n=1 Tax=Streptomyces sp. NPDC015125 TaxID=3364938 RepID=UPI0036F56A64